MYYKGKLKLKIESLTSLRFFAAIMVVFSHLSFMMDSKSITINQIYDTVFSEGYIGVTFFFILSGFILSYSYTDRMKSNRISTKQFFIARIARIYPLHLLTFCLSLPLVAYATYKNGGNLLNLLPNISLVQSFFPIKDVFFSANAPSWSLSNEMFFYLLFPFLMLRGSVFLLFISALIVSLQVYISFTALSQEQQHYWIYIFPVSRLLDFVFGILLFRLYIHFDSKNIKINPDLAQYTSISLLVICIALKDMVPQAYRYDLFYIIPMSMVIFSFAYSGGKISNFLSSKILVLLGEASFSLYLIHQLVIRYIKGVNEVLFGYEGVLWECILIVAILTLSILLSLAMHKLYEIKATKYAKSLLLKIKLRSDEEHNKAIQRTR